MIAAVTKIVGEDRVSNKQGILEKYTGDYTPSLVVWPMSSEEVVEIVAWANSNSVALVPVSSGLPKIRGSSVAKSKNTVVVDLQRMKSILRIDSRNRVAMIEAGVTFGDLLPELEKHGLRPLIPLLPKTSKSVVACALDQEPITTPRFHWDSPDPLLCTETVFGNGDLFRTGSAAGPGSLEEQWDSGQAQKNPMGPSQFDPYRILQGSQGTIGIVTWASVKCETKPKHESILLAGVKELEDLFDFAYAMLRRKLADHLFILNSLSLSAALRVKRDDIVELSRSLPKWILVLSFSGKSELAEEELEYRLVDAYDIAKDNGVELVEELGSISADKVQTILERPSIDPYWKLRFNGACREVFFLTTLDRTFDLYSRFVKSATGVGFPEDSIGVYLQPAIQGTNTHCFFDIYYDPDNPEHESRSHNLFLNGSRTLMENGAYFSRPVPEISDAVFSRSSPETISAMKRVKAIFDPNHVMSPGNLCFKEVLK